MMILDFDEDPKPVAVLDLEDSKAPEVSDVTEYRCSFSEHIESFASNRTIASSKDLADLHESLAQAVGSISISQNSAILYELEMVLDHLHERLNLWNLASCLTENDVCIWEGFLAMYCRIPEKFSAVFSSSQKCISNSKQFWNKIYKDLSKFCNAELTNAHNRLLKRCLSSGFQDYFYSTILSFPSFIQSSLLNGANDDNMIKLAIGTVALLNDEKPQERLYFLKIVDVLSNKEQVLMRVILDVRKYQSVPISNFVALLALLCWQRYLDNEADMLKSFLLEYKLKSYDRMAGHIIVTLLSFLSWSHLEIDFELNNLLLTFISQCLNHADVKVRLQGMVVGEIYGRLAPSEKTLYFEQDDSNPEIEEYRSTAYLIRNVDLWINSGSTFIPYKYQKPISEKEVEPVLTDDFYQIETIPTSAITQNSTIKSIQEPKNAKLKRPRFMRDAYEYLKTEDPEKWELALDSIADLVHTSFTLELKEFGLPIFKTLMFLSDQFAIEGFELKRMSLISLLIDHCPENSMRLLKTEFLGRSLNLSQKSDILTVIMEKLKAFINMKSSLHKAEVEELFRALMLVDETEIKEPSSKLTLQAILNHFYFPLLKEMVNVRCKAFLTAHDFLLEKTILCLSMFLYASSNSLDFPNIISPFLRFVSPIVADTEESYSAPVVRATLLSVHSLMQAWPKSINILPFLPELMKISSWIDGKFYSWPADTQELALAVKRGLSSVVDLHKLMKDVIETRESDMTCLTKVNITCKKL